VNFGHRQNDPVRLVVGLAAPDEEGHVTALGTLAEFLADDGRRDELLRSTGPDDLLRLVEAFEGDQASQMRRSTSDGKDLVDPK
jgi:PTS system ascorbate-specific IIA component